MINLVVEGPTDEIVARHLCELTGIPVATVYGRTGKTTIDRNIVIREDLIPAPGSSNMVGTGYTIHIADFVKQQWDAVTAATKSDSLHRCMKALKNFAERCAI